MGAEPLLQMRGISKSFSGTQALRGVDLAVRSGELHGLMGENGAGKSTLMKILTGVERADPGGEIRLAGRTVRIDDPRRARNLGIAIVHQELALCANLSVAENLFLGREQSRWGVLRGGQMERVCQGLLDRLGAGFRAGETVANLSVAERQLVEIARALQAQSRVLVLDEPTTALSTRETDRLFAILRELRAGGLALIYISHRMAEVEMLADRVTVLRDGALVGVLERAAVDSGEIVRLMVGRDLNTLYPRTRPRDPRDAVVLEVRDLADRRRVHPCSLRVHAGEVLGIAGMAGSGRTALARLIYGADERISGEVLLGGAPLSGSDPQASIRAGLAYVTEDRAALGLFAAMSLSDNVNLSVIGADSRGPGILDRGRAAARSAAAIEDLQIRGARDVAAGALSGGNQQKLLLARCLQWRPKVLILDEPTRGIDIGAKAEIYRIIDALAATGVGILVISSELPEIIGIADRVLVMREGAIAGELSGSGLTQRAIIGLATGVSGPRIH